jgi:hypothetical protein
MALSRKPMLMRQLIGVRGARVKLYCGACAWSKTYDPERLVERLEAKGVGNGFTAIMHVARHVAWPCPACGRTRWASAPYPDHWSDRR